MKDTFTFEERKLKDARRLYAPGRLYHIVVRKPLRYLYFMFTHVLQNRFRQLEDTGFKVKTMPLVYRLGRYPPVVRTAVPVDGRFEQIVLSCNATADHAIIWIERESQRALDVSTLKCVLLFVTASAFGDGEF